MKNQHNRILVFIFLLLITIPCSSFQNKDFLTFGRIVPPKDKPIIIYGDTRNGHAVHKKIVSMIINLAPEAVFHTGDLVFDGKSGRNWNTFNSIVGDLVKVAPLYPVRGNHERGNMRVNQDIKIPNDSKWYSVDVQNIHFIILDVCDKYRAGSEQYNWLVKDLENQPQATKYTVALTHYPFYSSGPHRTQHKKLQRELIPLFRKYGVDIVFSAHNHCYERSYADGIYYIVTAGGGAPLYNDININPYSQLYIKKNNFCTLEQNHDTLFVNAMDTTIHRIDHFFIPPAK
jgi:acid phosphatase type 7